MNRLILLFAIIVTLFSCNGRTENASGKTAAPNTDVALEFMNSYVKYFQTSPHPDPMSWVENSELATDEFKGHYKKIIADALAADPDLGLGFDPILNAQDYPSNGFEFVKLVEDEYVVVTGKNGAGFTNVVKIKYSVDRWLIDGVGVVNVEEEKRGL